LWTLNGEWQVLARFTGQSAKKNLGATKGKVVQHTKDFEIRAALLLDFLPESLDYLEQIIVNR
jgi:hypothetical protein